MKILIILLTALLSSGCFDNGQAQSPKKDSQLGKTVFAKNCAVCHGDRGQGLVKNWQQKQPNGYFPPPPLNGTAHTWHHSRKVLLRIVNSGNKRLGGQMPGFKGQLSEAEKHAVLDYIYSLWPNEIQQKYDAQFNR